MFALISLWEFRWKIEWNPYSESPDFQLTCSVVSYLWPNKYLFVTPSVVYKLVSKLVNWHPCHWKMSAMCPHGIFMYLLVVTCAHVWHNTNSSANNNYAQTTLQKFTRKLRNSELYTDLKLVCFQVHGELQNLKHIKLFFEYDTLEQSWQCL